MKAKKREGLPDVDLFEAILDLCGVSFRRSYFRGGWTRVVTVEVGGNEYAAWFDRWGVQYLPRHGMNPVETLEVAR